MTRYTREEIGLRPPEPGPGLLTPSRVEGIALHWPAMTTRLDTVPEVKAALRSWQRYHMDVRDWSDIAYQEAVDTAGNVYRLRGLAVQSGANGDTDVNERFGALLLVLAMGEAVTDAMAEAVQRRVERHRELFPRSTRIVGHRTIRPEPTACPGDLVMRAIAAGRFNPDRKD